MLIMTRSKLTDLSILVTRLQDAAAQRNIESFDDVSNLILGAITEIRGEVVEDLMQALVVSANKAPPGRRGPIERERFIEECQPD